MKLSGVYFLALLGHTLGEQSPTASVDPFVTTVFTQPPQCTGKSFSEVPSDPGVIWYNVIDNHVSEAYTSCYPEQFYRSVVAEGNGQEWGAFKKLVCPANWASYQLNSTYVVCCPADYNLVGLDSKNPDRPAATAACISTVWPGVLLELTSYDSTASSSVELYTVTGDGTYVMAMPFDGITTTPVTSTSSSSTSSSTTTTTTTTSSSSTTTKTTSSTSTRSSPTPTPDFHFKSHYHNDCTGDIYNDITIAAGGDQCINTDCQVASLDISAEGVCPDGEVQISYWEQPNCQGKWFGYGYASRGTCRRLWTDGYKWKSLNFRCAKKENDCVSQKQCTEDPEPSSNLC